MLRLRLRIARLYNGRLGSCQTPSIWQCQPHLIRAFTSSGAYLEDSKSDKPKIRWYEQLLPWSSKRRRVDPSDLGADENDEAMLLKREIQRLDKELREMEGEGQEGKTLIEPLLATLSVEDQQKAREAIRQDQLQEALKAKEAAQVKLERAKLLPKKEELEIQLQLPLEQSVHLRTLNMNLPKAAGNMADQDLRKKLWQAYARCKAFLPPFLHLIPDKAWSVLWASQQSISTDDPHWALHLIILSEDMLAAGKELDAFEMILYVEALRHQGRQDEAIVQWQNLENHLGDDKQALEEYELLGVRLFASHGNPQKAEEIALNYLGVEKQEDTRILIPILTAWAQRGDAVGIKHAWALYLRLRTQLGSKITMDDYDMICLGLLNVGRADLALAVFKDLMLSGGEQTEQGSLELYKKALGFMGKTQSSAITVEDLNKISITGLTVLPRRFQNKFFYGSWMKKLIGMGAVDAAASVIELMYERGVKPDSKHLNGIVGAWLRAGTVKDREAAEKMAWAMIYERLEFVKKRRQHSSIPSPAQVPSVQGVRLPPHLRRTVSPATIETFSLLLQYYARRSREENVQLIRDLLTMAEITPDSYFINHLLYNDLRHGQHQTAWKKYLQMFRRVKPDLETFACLWDCEKAHLDSLVIHRSDWFPGPRRIMSELMNWFSKLSRAERRPVREDFSKELYDQIVRCLGRAGDLSGILAALYAMKESFGLYPDQNTARLISIAVGRLGIGEPGLQKSRRGLQKRRRSRHRHPQREANVARISRVLQIMTEEREEVLVEAGLNHIQQCDADIQKEERLFVLAQFLRTVLRRMAVDEAAVNANIEKAAWEMGVSGVRMEDPLPSYNR